MFSRKPTEVTEKHLFMLYEHLSEKNSSKQALTCFVCSKKIFSTEHFNLHICKYHANYCQACETGFSSINKYVMHHAEQCSDKVLLNYQAKDKAIVCYLMPPSSSDNKGNRMNVIVCHKESKGKEKDCVIRMAQSIRDNASQVNVNLDAGDMLVGFIDFIICNKCGHYFTNSYYYLQHMKMTHFYNELPPFENIHECSLCGQTFESFQKHFELFHLKSFLCDICELVFSQNKALLDHLQRCHTQAFECKFCGAEFELKNALLAHIRSQHSDPKLYQQICDKALPSLTDATGKHHGKDECEWYSKETMEMDLSYVLSSQQMESCTQSVSSQTRQLMELSSQQIQSFTQSVSSQTRQLMELSSQQIESCTQSVSSQTRQLMELSSQQIESCTQSVSSQIGQLTEPSSSNISLQAIAKKDSVPTCSGVSTQVIQKKNRVETLAGVLCRVALAKERSNSATNTTPVQVETCTTPAQVETNTTPAQVKTNITPDEVETDLISTLVKYIKTDNKDKMTVVHGGNKDKMTVVHGGNKDKMTVVHGGNKDEMTVVHGGNKDKMTVVHGGNKDKMTVVHGDNKDEMMLALGDNSTNEKTKMTLAYSDNSSYERAKPVVKQKFIDIRRRTCHICSKIFTRPIDVSRHIKLVHENKFFPCDQCSKGFKGKMHLLRHVRAHHTSRNGAAITFFDPDSVDPSCNKCFKLFVSSDALSLHQQLYHSRARYKCEECKVYFRDSEYLDAHQKKIHENVKT